MQLTSRICGMLIALVLGMGALLAETAKMTPPAESLSGLRPGSLTVPALTEMIGKPDITQNGGLLYLYGGAKESTVYGWYAVEDPEYTIPDLAVETPKGSNRIDLVMAIGYGGLTTEKGTACFDTEADMLKAYGKPTFAYEVPMSGMMLREYYYPSLGISFDVAPVGNDGGREVIAIYVTYPEFLQGAIDMRKQMIKDGTGRDITGSIAGTTT